MATASVSITPECSICCEVFKTPKFITCGHTFCQECIDRYIGDKTETFPCPICQQDIQIPEGGAKMFTTNFSLVPKSQNTTQVTGTTSPTTQVTASTSPTTQLTDKTSSNVKYHCQCNQERPIDYYCLTCHCVLCHRCFLKEHRDHEYLDVESETTKEKATELVLTSEKFIQNKIKYLEETHVTLVEAREKLQRFTDDACSRITKQTDKIIADLKASRERIMTDIKSKSEESESKLTNAVEKTVGQIKNFKLNLEANFPSLIEDADLQILVSLGKIKKLEELCKELKVETPSVVRYLDWEEIDFSLDIEMFGSTMLNQYHISKLHESTVLKQDHIPKPNESKVLKQDHIPKLNESKVLKQDQIPQLHKSNSYRFHFNKDDINRSGDWYYSQDKFCYGNMVWSCGAKRHTRNLNIYIDALQEDNPRLKFCYVDFTTSLVNINDDSESKTRTYSFERFDSSEGSRWWKPITWPELIDKDNGFLDEDDEFVIQLSIQQIRGR